MPRETKAEGIPHYGDAAVAAMDGTRPRLPGLCNILCNGVARAGACNLLGGFGLFDEVGNHCGADAARKPTHKDIWDGANDHNPEPHKTFYQIAEHFEHR